MSLKLFLLEWSTKSWMEVIYFMKMTLQLNYAVRRFSPNMFGKTLFLSSSIRPTMLLRVSSSRSGGPPRVLFTICWSSTCFKVPLVLLVFSGWGQGFRSLPCSVLQVSLFMGFAVIVEFVKTTHFSCKFHCSWALPWVLSLSEPHLSGGSGAPWVIFGEPVLWKTSVFFSVWHLFWIY